MWILWDCRVLTNVVQPVFNELNQFPAWLLCLTCVYIPVTCSMSTKLASLLFLKPLDKALASLGKVVIWDLYSLYGFHMQTVILEFSESEKTSVSHRLGFQFTEIPGVIVNDECNHHGIYDLMVPWRFNLHIHRTTAYFSHLPSCTSHCQSQILII
jgi:hypothetical protein